MFFKQDLLHIIIMPSIRAIEPPHFKGKLHIEYIKMIYS